MRAGRSHLFATVTWELHDQAGSVISAWRASCTPALRNGEHLITASTDHWRDDAGQLHGARRFRREAGQFHPRRALDTLRPTAPGTVPSPAPRWTADPSTGAGALSRMDAMSTTEARPAAINHRQVEHPEGVVHTLTVSNPKRLNVLTSALMDELRLAIERRAGEAGARVVLLRGAGAQAWIGGSDGDEVATLDTAGALAFAGRLKDVCTAIRQAPVPVIAVIRGYCVGPGLEIAASCDMRIAAHDASFGLPDVYAGIPAVAGAALLPLLIGIGRTRELALTGRMIDARTAHAWGLIGEVVAPGPVLDGLVDARVGEILMGAPEAVRLQKRLCRLWEERPLKESLELGLKAFARAFAGDEPVHYFQGREAGKDTQF